MRLKSALFALGMVASVFAQSAPIPVTNVRPVPAFGVSGEPTLQSILNSFTSVGDINVETDQAVDVYWASAVLPPTTVPTMAVEYTANAGVQEFGFWFGSDTLNFLRVPLFLGGAIGNPLPADGINRSVATVQFAPGAILVSGSADPLSASTCGQEIVCGLTVNPLISSGMFGMYFRTGDLYVYSSDFLTAAASPNAGSRPRFLAYESNSRPTNWFFAYEDGSDFDYNDMVVKIESITSVPVPGSVALLGIGLLALGSGSVLRRKRSA